MGQCRVSPMGFEPMRISTLQLKCNPLDHSGTVTFVLLLWVRVLARHEVHSFNEYFQAVLVQTGLEPVTLALLPLTLLVNFVRIESTLVYNLYKHYTLTN